MRTRFWIRKRRCLCNIGAQACPRHPKHLLTKEQKIQARKDWDERVERGQS